MVTVIEALLPIGGAAVSAVGLVVTNSLRTQSRNRRAYEERISSQHEQLQQAIQNRYETVTKRQDVLTKELTDAQLSHAVALTELTKGLESITSQLARLGAEAREDRMEIFKRIGNLEQGQARHTVLLEQTTSQLRNE